jgi:hypothetical protein
MSFEQHVREESVRETFPYIVEFDVPAEYAIPSAFTCARFRGLRFCHLLAPPPPSTTSPRPAKLVSFWQDHESYALQALAVSSELGGPTIAWQGHQTQARTRDKPKWWKKTASVYVVAVHAVAVVGTFDALMNHYAELFAPGNVQVFNQGAEYDVVSDQLNVPDEKVQLGEPFRLSYKVRNVGAAPTALSLTGVGVVPVAGWDPADPLAARPDCARAPAASSAPRPDPGLAVRNDLQRIPAIAVGGVEEVSLSGLARRDGRFCVAVEGTARSGIVRRLVLKDSPFHANLNVRVWPQLGVSVAFAGISKDLCLYRVALNSGLAFPEGVGMTATLKRVAGAKFSFLHPVASASEPYADVTPGTEITEARWITHPLAAKKDAWVTLELRKPGATERDCKDIASSIAINRVAIKELKG